MAVENVVEKSLPALVAREVEVVPEGVRGRGLLNLL